MELEQVTDSWHMLAQKCLSTIGRRWVLLVKLYCHEWQLDSRHDLCYPKTVSNPRIQIQGVLTKVMVVYYRASELVQKLNVMFDITHHTPHLGPPLFEGCIDGNFRQAKRCCTQCLPPTIKWVWEIFKSVWKLGEIQRKILTTGVWKGEEEEVTGIFLGLVMFMSTICCFPNSYKVMIYSKIIGLCLSYWAILVARLCYNQSLLETSYENTR